MSAIFVTWFTPLLINFRLLSFILPAWLIPFQLVYSLTSTPTRGNLLDTFAIRSKFFLSDCPFESDGRFSTGGMSRAFCRLVSNQTLSRLGSRHFRLLRYEHSSNAEACVLHSTLLVEKVSHTHLRPLWWDSLCADEESIDDVRVIASSKGSFLDIVYCLRGTGGCTQTTYRARGSRWSPLTRDASWDAVYANLPPDYSPTKSALIDFRSLLWTQNIAHRADANCCPTGRIEFVLDVVDSMLIVKTYRITIPR